MPKISTIKPRVPIQILLTEKQREILIREATKEGISMSELGRRIIEEAIKESEEARHAY